MKTPKSVLFPTVIKSLCNNTEVIKIINQYGHGISYDKVGEIETEYALKVIDELKQSRVIILECFTANSCKISVALMVAENIDNLENTITGSRTSHRVNSILVTMKAPETNQEVEEGEEEYCRPTKRSSLSEIPDYYGGKLVGPGKLNEVKNPF